MVFTVFAVSKRLCSANFILQRLLESVLDRFPDNVLANTFYLATMRVFEGDLEKAMGALEEGHCRGVFYGLWDFNAEYRSLVFEGFRTVARPGHRAYFFNRRRQITPLGPKAEDDPETAFSR